MIQEQADRMTVGWSREQLAQASGVEVSAVYLLERMGSASPEDDARMRTALAQRKAEHGRRSAQPDANEQGYPHNGQEANDTGMAHNDE